MAYSTPAMVRQALVPSSDGSVPEEATNTAADLSDGQLQDAIAEADSIIDGYIGGFYKVPVAANDDGAAPHPIDFWSRNIAAYNATLTYRESQDFSDQDPVARRYTATMQALQAVSTGKVRLGLTPNTSDSAQTGAGDPINPYTGELFTTDDFDLRPAWAYPYPSPFWDPRW